MNLTLPVGGASPPSAFDGSLRRMRISNGVGDEALKPGQLVLEFRSGLRIPIGEVDGSDQDSLNRCFNVASLMIFSIFDRCFCQKPHNLAVF